MSEEALDTEAPEVEDNLDDELSPEELDRATRQGWAPEEEWKGPKEQWVDAKTFLKRGDEILPIVRANNKKLEQELADLKAERENDKKIFEDFQKFQDENRKREEKEYKRELAELKAAKAKAVADGDSAAFTQADAAEDQLRDDYQSRQAESKPKEPNQPGEHPDWQPWLQENDWYLDDEEMGAMADAMGQRIAEAKPHLTGKAFYDEVKARVQHAMPHKFENPNRSKPNAVEAGGGGKTRSRGKTYSDLPAEAKQACDGFCKTIPGYTKEQYVKDFDWSAVQ